MSIKLIIIDDIYWHIFSLCMAECFEGHPLTTRIFLAWLGMIGTETLVCKNYQSWNHLITYGYHFTAVFGINRTVEYLWSKMPIFKMAWYYVNMQQLTSSYSINVTHQSRLSALLRLLTFSVAIRCIKVNPLLVFDLLTKKWMHERVDLVKKWLHSDLTHSKKNLNLYIPQLFRGQMG